MFSAVAKSSVVARSLSARINSISHRFLSGSKVLRVLLGAILQFFFNTQKTCSKCTETSALQCSDMILFLLSVDEHRMMCQCRWLFLHCSRVWGCQGENGEQVAIPGLCQWMSWSLRLREELSSFFLFYYLQSKITVEWLLSQSCYWRNIFIVLLVIQKTLELEVLSEH